jgi:hypothetical protein
MCYNMQDSTGTPGRDTGTHASPSLASLLPLRSYQVHDDEEALVHLAQQCDTKMPLASCTSSTSLKTYSYIAFRVSTGLPVVLLSGA